MTCEVAIRSAALVLLAAANPLHAQITADSLALTFRTTVPVITQQQYSKTIIVPRRAPPPSYRFDQILPECGHHLTLKEDTSVMVELDNVWGATSIPEYHDCQRMISSNDAYQHLMAIYATQQSKPPVPQKTLAYLVAEILNFGPPPGSLAGPVYTPLGIPPGASCIYANWALGRAWVVSLGGQEGQIHCTKATIPIQQLGTPTLSAVRTVFSDVRPQDYPQVARWDWDRRRKEQYIGAECGHGWCEIGRPGFTSSPLPQMIQIAASTHPKYKVKGWFDYQRLAVPAVGSYPLRPGAWGLIAPMPELDSKNESDFVGPGGVDAAVYWIEKHSLTYSDKYRMSPLALTTANVRNPGTGAPWQWIGQLRRGGLVRTHNVVFTRHTDGIRVRGTTRWRWSEKDETSWTSCINGCCQINPL